jgi:hypothetical protein
MNIVYLYSNMKLKLLILFFFFPFVLVKAQTDTIGKTRYTSEFKFHTGVYMSFDEFKTNSPSILDFRLSRQGNFSEGIVLEIPCQEDKNNWCELKSCWGYCDKGNVYISQNYGSYFFRLQIIGSLIHYIGFEGFEQNYYDGNRGAYNYYMPTGATPKFSEFFIDFQTGKTYLFTYKVFRDFLEVKDFELYQELINIKKKRKMYTHFLFKYNQKHPVYF